MKVELELWHVLMLMITGAGAFWGLAQMLIAASQRSIGDRFSAISDLISASQRSSADKSAAISELIRAQSDLIRGQGEDMRRIERDLMSLKAELPRDYVRREDHTQIIATIMTKLDHATLLMQQAVRDAYAQAFKGPSHPHKDSA